MRRRADGGNLYKLASWSVVEINWDKSMDM